MLTTHWGPYLSSRSSSARSRSAASSSQRRAAPPSWGRTEPRADARSQGALTCWRLGRGEGRGRPSWGDRRRVPCRPRRWWPAPTVRPWHRRAKVDGRPESSLTEVDRRSAVSSTREVAASYWAAKCRRDIDGVMTHYHEDATYQDGAGLLRGQAGDPPVLRGIGPRLPGPGGWRSCASIRLRRTPPGFRLEPRGRSGFAHLFEHMMFQGSENAGKMVHIKLVNSSGGVLNGSTHYDVTNYFEAVPSNALERVLWLESDRMRALKVDDEISRNQRDVVKEEVRVNVVEFSPMADLRGSIYRRLLSETGRMRTIFTGTSRIWMPRRWLMCASSSTRTTFHRMRSC